VLSSQPEEGTRDGFSGSAIAVPQGARSTGPENRSTPDTSPRSSVCIDPRLALAGAWYAGSAATRSRECVRSRAYPRRLLRLRLRRREDSHATNRVSVAACIARWVLRSRGFTPQVACSVESMGHPLLAEESFRSKSRGESCG
jgi:hypothetical protein